MNPAATASPMDEAWLRAAFDRFQLDRDLALRDEIAAHMSWLAERSARRFWDSGEPFDDLVQVAQIGLLKAIDRFDPTMGVPFGAYATPTVLGELRRHFRDHTWGVHVPRRAKDLRAAVNATKDDLAKELGRSPLIEEIAIRLSVPADRVIESLEANNAYRPHSLDAGSQGPAADDDDLEQVLTREVLDGLLHRLPARERHILTLRYYDELSQDQIAQRIGTSQVHVGRLIASSLAALRAVVAEGAAHDDV
jgi:RNA polymerase sigma-B factor